MPLAWAAGLGPGLAPSPWAAVTVTQGPAPTAGRHHQWSVTVTVAVTAAGRRDIQSHPRRALPALSRLVVVPAGRKSGSER